MIAFVKYRATIHAKFQLNRTKVLGTRISICTGTQNCSMTSYSRPSEMSSNALRFGEIFSEIIIRLSFEPHMKEIQKSGLACMVTEWLDQPE